MKAIYKKYKHGIPMVIFFLIYLIGFAVLENRGGRVAYTMVHLNVDDYIPFCEVFVVPYLLWFLYVPAVVLYLLFRDREGYWKNAVFLMIGMSVFLILSACIPNAHNLRLRVMPRDNVFTWLIGLLWRADTPTNLFPSIHVYNSLAAHIAVMHNRSLAGKRWIRYGSFTLCTLIILSTVLIKQHSVFDVLTAFVLGAAVYWSIYNYDLVNLLRLHLRIPMERRRRRRAWLDKTRR